eukprot:7351733-Prymnesium_polylepis.1
MCSPQLLRLQVGISARPPSTPSTATRRPQVEASAHPTVARIHPYSCTPRGSSSVAYFTTLLRSCRAVPPDVSQVPKSALIADRGG